MDLLLPEENQACRKTHILCQENLRANYLNCAVELQGGQVADDGTGTYGKSLVQTSALKMSAHVTFGESVHPLYLYFPIFICPTYLFNLEFIPRRALPFMCWDGARTPLLSLALGQVSKSLFPHITDPQLQYPQATRPSEDRQSRHSMG